MTVVQLHFWFAAWSQALWVGFMVGIIAGLVIETIASAEGSQLLRRAVPMVALAVTLAVAGVMRKTQPVQTPARISAPVRQPAWVPYCDDWLYYTQPMCWFES